jgi:transposase
MTEAELERRARRRLAVLRHVEEVSGNVAATCRYYGISRQCYYGWLGRYEADGLEGLKDRSQRPHRSPRATRAEVIEKIIWLRRHYPFWASQDRHVPGPLPRRHDQHLWGVADLETARLTGCPHPSATSAGRCGGSVMRSNAPATSSRSTSNSSKH